MDVEEEGFIEDTYQLSCGHMYPKVVPAGGGRSSPSAAVSSPAVFIYSSVSCGRHFSASVETRAALNSSSSRTHL